MEIRPILSALLRSKTGAVLVALQVAISLAILANALHIVNLRQAVAARPSGIAQEEQVVHIGVRHLVKSSANEQAALQKRETAALRAVAGVRSAAFTNQFPLSQSGHMSSVAADPKQERETGHVALYYSPDSLIQTWQMQLVEGRDFRPEEIMDIDNDAEGDAFPAFALITRTLASKLWPNASGVVGKTFYNGTGSDAKALRVVGVVERLQTIGGGRGDKGELSMILPIRMTNGFGTIYAIRAEAGQRERVTREAQAALRAANGAGNPVILDTTAFEQTRKNRYRADMALSWMLITVSVLLLIITASGIVGMASLWVIQRRKQIGVRRALGARKVDILRYFITENIMITTVGVVAGVMLAAGLNQLLVAQLHMARLPLGYLVSGAAVFWALGVAAVYGPAWRAASTSPALATRST
ncbi:ABC transporter permease [Massilia sp. S19_KUP03_FR1]|uniref:ABC transporter permease n=1 Tax=Massilia sp. S19_KUP03_FR1 TaxID=3025503 RepID=UPI002FCD7461